MWLSYVRLRATTSYLPPTTYHLIQRRHTPAEGLDVLPDLRVIAARVFIGFRARGRMQVLLQVAQRGGEVVHVVRQQPSVAQFRECRRIDREQKLGDVSRLRERVQLHI